MIYYKTQKNSRGYTLLFAVLVSSLVLAVGISILNISKKEFLIATSTRDSSAAFYAADGGLECALYGDVGKNPVDGTFWDAFNTTSDNTANLKCDIPLRFITKEFSPPGPDQGGKFVFHAKFGSTGSSCAVVTVTKVYTGTPVRLKVTIDSRGYNTGWRDHATDANSGFCDVASVKRVERALSYVAF